MHAIIQTLKPRCLPDDSKSFKRQKLSCRWTLTCNARCFNATCKNIDYTRPMLKVVVLLLCVLGPVAPVGQASQQSRKYYEVDLPTDDWDDIEYFEAEESPWLEPQQLQVPLSASSLSSDEDGVSDPSDMSPAEAAAILTRVTEAAQQRQSVPSHIQLRDFSKLEISTGIAHLAEGFLDTAADAAAMQFISMGSPDGAAALPASHAAPAWTAAPSPAPAPLPLSGALAPAEPSQQLSAAAAGSPPPAPPPSPLSFTTPATAAAFDALHAPSSAASPADLSREAQLPELDLSALSGPPPAPPFIPAGATAQPPASAPSSSDQQEQDGGQPDETSGTIKASVMGRGLWTGHGKTIFPTDPQVPPAAGSWAPAAFCNPDWGLEPTDTGLCVCMQGYGTNADMRTCSRCPVGWYSRGGQVGVAFCKPCPQLSTSNPTRTACVVRRSVITPDVAQSMCEFCVIPERPFAPPTCCPRGQVCCGTQGCCPRKRCISNGTTNFLPRCCGDDCNIGQSLNCCPGGQICVNITGANTQSCCLAGNVCGDSATKSCCNTNQLCCGNRDCCNVGANAFPRQTCAQNNITGPPVNDFRCCLETQINCNGTCCTTLDSPPTQRCLVDATGLAQCCNQVQLCISLADGITQCCSASGSVCTRNTTATGQLISRCCPAGYSLCPKNSFQPICCVVGKCPSPSSPDNCLP